MAYLYDPGLYMPATAGDFDGSSWMISWPDGPWHLHDVEVGGTVLLVDVDAQRLVWETQVTHAFMVPYEANHDLRSEILRRWGLDANVSEMVPGGFAIGWRARAIRRLDRGPICGDLSCGIRERRNEKHQLHHAPQHLLVRCIRRRVVRRGNGRHHC